MKIYATFIIILLRRAMSTIKYGFTCSLPCMQTLLFAPPLKGGARDYLFTQILN